MLRVNKRQLYHFWVQPDCSAHAPLHALQDPDEHGDREDEDADEDVGDVDDVDVKGLQGIVEDGIFEVDDGWMLCESWQSCPIGSYIPFK